VSESTTPSRIAIITRTTSQDGSYVADATGIGNLRLLDATRCGYETRRTNS
jgi:hypothetical protein